MQSEQLLRAVGQLVDSAIDAAQVTDLHEAIATLRKITLLANSDHDDNVFARCCLVKSLLTRFAIYGWDEDLLDAWKHVHTVIKAAGNYDRETSNPDVLGAWSSVQDLCKHISFDSLATAIFLAEDGLAIAEQDVKIQLLHNVGRAHVLQYFARRDEQSLANATRSFQTAHSVAGPGDPWRYICSIHLGLISALRIIDLGYLDAIDEANRHLMDAEGEDADASKAFDVTPGLLHSSDPKKLDEAIDLLQLAAFLRPHPHPKRGGTLGNLGLALFLRYDDTKSPNDLKLSLEAHHEALRLRPPSHPSRSIVLNGLGMALSSRYDTFGQQEDLFQCISAYKEILDITHDDIGQPTRYAALFSLEPIVYKRFQAEHDAADLDECVELRRKVLQLRPAGHPQHADAIDKLANRLIERITHSMQSAGGQVAGNDLDEVISLYKGAVSENGGVGSYPLRVTFLSKLIAFLHSRHVITNNVADLEDAISHSRLLLHLMGPTHPQRGSILENMGNLLESKYNLDGSQEDLNEWVATSREATELPPIRHPKRVMSLIQALSARRERTHSLDDLDEIISLYRDILPVIADSPQLRVMIHKRIAMLLRRRYEEGGKDRETLEAAIAASEDYIAIVPQDLASEEVFSNLALCLQERSQITGSAVDLDQSIEYGRQLLTIYPEEHEHRFNALVNLSSCFTIRFERGGNFDDLDEAISLGEQALASAEPSHPNRPAALNNLASALTSRFRFHGRMEDIERAIFLLREKMRANPPPSRDFIFSSINLSAALMQRREQKGDIEDLIECIALTSLAAQLAKPSDTDIDYVTILANHASLVTNGYRAGLGTIKELEGAVANFRKALDLLPPAHAARYKVASNLAIAVRSLYDATHDAKYLEECITLDIEVLAVVQKGHPDRPRYLTGLSSLLIERFTSQKDLVDLEVAILCIQDALDLTPEASLYRPKYVRDLAQAFSERYDHLREESDRTSAFELYQQAALDENALPLDRLNLIRNWVDFSRSHGFPSAVLEGYKIGIGILPMIVSLDMTIEQRSNVLRNVGDFACDAIQCAIEAQDLQRAVVFLATGRSLFWSRALQLRTSGSLVNLKSTHPFLEDKFQSLCVQLEQLSLRSRRDVPMFDLDTSTATSPTAKPLENVSPIALTQQWNRVVNQIRAIDGFSDFLLPPSFDKIKLAASQGPLVVLNASRFGCHALILQPNQSLSQITLPRIDSERLRSMAVIVHKLSQGLNAEAQRSIDELQVTKEERGLKPKGHRQNPMVLPMSPDDQFRVILEELWFSVARPVIEELQLTKSDIPTTRLWWCCTGAFSALPIHAAGTREGSVYDYAISSYCTSPVDLLSAPPHLTTKNFKMLAIIEPSAADAPPLPHTISELAKIRKHVANASQLTAHVGSGANPTKPETVIKDASSSSFVHFGCHAFQNSLNPLESYLLLSGGELTMAKLIGEGQTLNRPLAYLSACETAKGDARLPNESLNLVATMMFAGFKGVVGTLWSIYDADGPIVADAFYAHLFRKGHGVPPNPTDAALGLHLAVMELRRHGRSFRRWVPFVHFGL